MDIHGGTAKTAAQKIVCDRQRIDACTCQVLRIPVEEIFQPAGDAVFQISGQEQRRAGVLAHMVEAAPLEAGSKKDRVDPEKGEYFFRQPGRKHQRRRVHHDAQFPHGQRAEFMHQPRGCDAAAEDQKRADARCRTESVPIRNIDEQVHQVSGLG